MKSTIVTVPVAASAPGIFSAEGSGKGQGQITNEDGTPNGQSNPAHLGSVVASVATGEGQTNPPGIDGKIAADVLPVPLLSVVVLIGGQRAEMVYAGAQPSAVAGLLQVKARIPTGLTPDANTPIVIEIDNESQSGITIAIAP